VRKNPTNQLVVHEHLDFMLHQMIMGMKTGECDVALDIAATISEIFRDNEDLCEIVTEKDLIPFMDIVFEYVPRKKKKKEKAGEFSRK
jgi:hypothetical protein